jgi:hypothetical protein
VRHPLQWLASRSVRISAVAMALVGFAVIFAGWGMASGAALLAIVLLWPIVWTGDHLDAVRRLQHVIAEPARVTAGG